MSDEAAAKQSQEKQRSPGKALHFFSTAQLRLEFLATARISASSIIQTALFLAPPFLPH